MVSSRYVMVEIHYNNPKQLSGLLDSSGMRLVQTFSYFAVYYNTFVNIHLVLYKLEYLAVLKILN